MSQSWWTSPELRAAIAAAQSGLSPTKISAHLQQLGYKRRSATAISHRISKEGMGTGTGNKPWTDAEVAALRAAYINGTPLQAAAPTRTKIAIHHKGKELELAGTHAALSNFAGDVWTPEEESRLIAIYPTMRSADAAVLLGRSLHSVCRRAKRLGVTTGYWRPWADDELRAIRIAHAQGLSVVDLAEALGRGVSVISRQARLRMGLYFNRRANKAPKCPRSKRAPLTLESVLAMESGGVVAQRSVWSGISYSVMSQ